MEQFKNIGDEIKWIKFKTGVTARHIGDLVNVTPATIWNWIMNRSEPSASQMDIIRKFFAENITE